MQTHHDTASITLAAGTNSRIPPELRPKACVRVGGQTVIERTLYAYEQAGISRHVVVVGPAAGPIRRQLAGRDNVMFAIQPEPRGTGDAARCGLDLLVEGDPPEWVLICAGDKLIAPHVVKDLLDVHAETKAEFSLVAGRSEDNPGSGRIIERDGLAEGIVEVPDIRVRRIAAVLRSLPEGQRPRTQSELRSLVEGHMPDPVKLAGCLPDLARLIGEGGESSLAWAAIADAIAHVPAAFALPGGRVTVDEADHASWANLSLYVGRFRGLRDAVRDIRSENAQGEWYLTDILQIFASQGKRATVYRLTDPEDLMTFNTLEELEKVKNVFARRGIS